MKAKHAPGRFSVYQNPRMIHLSSVIDHKAGGYLVRDISPDTAQLIACAPELLEALIFLVSEVKDQTEIPVIMAKKIIAKATGGAE